MTPKQREVGIDVLLLGMRSLVAKQELVAQEATRENKLDGWLSDHSAHMRKLDAELQELMKTLAKLLEQPVSE